MKKKVILGGTILVGILLVLLINKTLNLSVSHAEPTSNKLYDIIKNETIDNKKGAKFEGEHADAYDYSGTKDIYYYKVAGYNNVRLKDFCWQIIRTTDTGGVKLIYNGLYTEENKCNNTGDASEIGQSAFSFEHNSIAYIGYMYNPDTMAMLTRKESSYTDVLWGEDVVYENGFYTLTGVQEIYDDNHKYTCNNSTGTCQIVKYVYSYDEIELLDGRNIDQAIYDMLYADDVNKVDSTVKSFIDNWYSQNMQVYNNFFEDTVFCNDREIINNNVDIIAFTFKSFNLEAPTNITNISCKYQTDRFSTLNPKAQLTYKVGLPTFNEMGLLDISIRRNNSNYYTLSPLSIHFGLIDNGVVLRNGLMGWKARAFSHTPYGIRPSVSLKPNVEVSSGSGTTDDPYILDENLKYDITTKVNNGTITESITEIDEGSTKIIEYSPKKGYQLKSITIDGQEVDINEYPNSYTFGSIDNDHEIKVVFEKASYNIEISKKTDIKTDEIFNFMLKTKANINGNNEHIKVIKNFVKPVYDTSTLSVEEFIEASKNDNDAENDLAFKVYLAKKENDEWKVVEESKVFPDGWEKQSEEEMQYTYEFGHVNDGSEYAVFESRIFPDKCLSEYTIINHDYDNNSKHYFMDNNEGNITFVYADDEYTKLFNCTENCDNYHVSFDTKHTYIINQVVNNQVEITNDYIYQLGCLPSWDTPWISDFNDPDIYVKKDEDNVYEFSIRSGDKYVVKGMPYETKYELWEEEKEGWKLESIDGEAKMKVENTVSENTTHIFKNVKIEEQEEKYTPKEDIKEFKGTTKVQRIATPLTIDRIISYIVLAIMSIVIVTGLVISISKARKVKTFD